MLQRMNILRSCVSTLSIFSEALNLYLINSIQLHINFIMISTVTTWDCDFFLHFPNCNGTQSYTIMSVYILGSCRLRLTRQPSNLIKILVKQAKLIIETRNHRSIFPIFAGCNQLRAINDKIDFRHLGARQRVNGQWGISILHYDRYFKRQLDWSE